MNLLRQSLVPMALLISIITSPACQSPTDPDETLDIDDVLEMTVAPNPAIAVEATDGLTYRVVRGNNQPDEILPYDWRTSFTITATFNGEADDEDALEFPVDITSITVAVKQASGGIVTPPTGGETEKYHYVTQASTNRYGAAGSGVTVAFDVWYDLPSLRKEALVTVTFSFKDDDGGTFTKNYDVRVAP